MNCPVCGKPYPCVHGRGLQTDLGAGAAETRQPAASLPRSSPATEAKSRPDREQWRQEVVMRLRRHRARRGRGDAASLELDFSSDEELVAATQSSIATSDETNQTASGVAEAIDQEPGPGAVTISESHVVARPQRKIIRFPRHPRVEPVIVARPPIEEIELAEPAPEAPRILDAPEPEAHQMDLLPSFADIRLDEAPPGDLCEELKSIPQPASLTRRMAAGVVDIGIVLFACGLFAVTFMQMVTGLPSSRSTMIYGIAVAVVLWLLFQYLFLVQSTATPGMRAAQLDLASFQGRCPSRFARGLRTLATALSALSVGLGFAWALVDEDTLGWHDRISQTYLKSSN